MESSNPNWQGDPADPTWQQREVIHELPPTPKGPEHKVINEDSTNTVYSYAPARENQHEIGNQSTYMNQVPTVKSASSPQNSPRYEYIQHEKSEKCSNIYSASTPQCSNRKIVVNQNYTIWLQNELLNSQRQQINLLELWKDKSSNITQGRIVKQQQQFDHRDPQGYHYKLQRWIQEQMKLDQEEKQNSFAWFMKTMEKENQKRKYNSSIWQPPQY